MAPPPFLGTGVWGIDFLCWEVVVFAGGAFAFAFAAAGFALAVAGPDFALLVAVLALDDVPILVPSLPVTFIA